MHPYRFPICIVASVASALLSLSASAQLAITEVMSSASTNLGTTALAQSSDFWEVTNFGADPVNLNGYKWNDNGGGVFGADPLPFANLTIEPGESILFMETNNPVMTTAEQFRAWWNLPPTQKVIVYIGNGLSSAGDSVILWDAADRLVDSVDFLAAERGRSFVYDPATGLFGMLSTNGVGGAFKAATADDEGSPGKTTGPVAAQIITHPASQKVNPGDSATFTVTAGGLPRPTYQWLFNGAQIDGATSSTLTVLDVQTSKLGDYSVSVNNGVMSLVSSNATLSLNPQPEPPLFVVSPRNQNAFIGQRVTFTSLASGTPQPTYQWYQNGVLLGNATPSFTLPSLALTDDGTYRVIATNPLGSATNEATLHVTRRPRLVITEIMPAQNTSGPSGGHNDWWELTNFDDFTVDLSGYRFDDNSQMLGAAVTFTNSPLTIAPGESIVFVENTTPERFRAWWGEENFRPGQQIITYRGAGLGLSSSGDGITLWNSAASEDFDTISSEVFSTATTGVSFRWDPDTPVFKTLSTNGFFGAYAARENADIGSPGYISNPIEPRILSFRRESAGWVLTWRSIPGRSYTVQFITNLGGTDWSPLGTFPSSDPIQTAADTTATGVPRRFYRVLLEP